MTDDVGTSRTSWWVRVGSPCRRGFRRVSAKWRTSIQFRVGATTLTTSAVTLIVVCLYLTVVIRDGLFNDGLDQALAETGAATQSAQSAFDGSNAQTGAQSLQLFRDVLPNLEGTGQSRREVFLLQDSDNSNASPISIGDYAATPELESAITSQLRDAVTSNSGQRWQSVEFERDGQMVPGIAIGTPVTLPVGGEYELFFLVSLQQQENTLSFILMVLLAGAVVIIILLTAAVLFVTRGVVRPVREAAAVAERLAEGKLDERMFHQGEDEMARLARSFNAMATSLEDKISEMAELSRLQRQFVSDVSHELRTPLTTMRMASEVLFAGREEFLPALGRSAELLATQLDRFEELLTGLLEISRFDAGAAVLEIEHSDVTEIVRSAINLAAPLAESTSVPIITMIPTSAVMADVDSRRIERILRNLVVNAIEHAEARPIVVKLAANETTVAIVVRDHGVGMTVEESQRVFDRFWRADPARARTTGGTGLGLSIAAEDTNLHGGELAVWGASGEGASFRLLVPRTHGGDLGESPLPLVEIPQLPAAPATTASDAEAVPDSSRASGMADSDSEPTDADGNEART